MKDKNGKEIKDGDKIIYDGIPYPMIVRHDSVYGWMADNPPPMDPIPQKIDGLGHRFSILDE